MLDARITDTFIGREFGWDRVSEADPALLRNNREAAMRVIDNPADFPNAQFEYLHRRVKAIDEFFFDHGDMLDQFA